MSSYRETVSRRNSSLIFYKANMTHNCCYLHNLLLWILGFVAWDNNLMFLAFCFSTPLSLQLVVLGPPPSNIAFESWHFILSLQTRTISKFQLNHWTGNFIRHSHVGTCYTNIEVPFRSKTKIDRNVFGLVYSTFFCAILRPKCRQSNKSKTNVN